MSKTVGAGFTIEQATEKDVPIILGFIRELAEYENLLDEAKATEAELREFLFGEKKYAEVLIGYFEEKPVAFLLYFHNFSTFIGRPGIYMEDLYVQPKMRGKGLGKELIRYLAGIARERKCGRIEWAVLNWNDPAIQLYKNLNAKPMDEWTVFRLTADQFGGL